MKVGIVVGVVIAVLALVICLVPLKEVVYAVTVDYEDVETYIETELVPQVEILENHMDIEDDVLWVRGEVKNSSNITFAIIDVDIHAICPVRDVEDSYSAKSVVLGYPAAFKPGEVRNFSATFNRNLVEDSYTLKIYQPLAEISVEKERTVTKQRQETRYKKVTLLDYLLHY